MNKNQVEGTAKDVAGKVKRKVGEITGSANQQDKGAENQIEGKHQKGVGNAQQAQDDADKETRKQRRTDRTPAPQKDSDGVSSTTERGNLKRCPLT